jgi:hypothetical protein
MARRGEQKRQPSVLAILSAVGDFSCVCVSLALSIQASLPQIFQQMAIFSGEMIRMTRKEPRYLLFLSRDGEFVQVLRARKYGHLLEKVRQARRDQLDKGRLAPTHGKLIGCRSNNKQRLHLLPDLKAWIDEKH